MPKFKDREEYEKWKVKQLENILKLEQEENHDSKITQSSGWQIYKEYVSVSTAKNWKVIITIGLLLFIVSILLYTTLRKGSKSELIQETKKSELIQLTKELELIQETKKSELIQETKELTPVVKTKTREEQIQETKEPVAVIKTKSWPELIEKTKNAIVTIRTQNTFGSGFLFSSGGLLFTNSHVIQDKADIKVTFNSQKTRKAYIIQSGRPPLDIAILQVVEDESDLFDPLTLGDSDNCTEGEEVVAIGAPLELSQTVTKGIISNCNRQLKDELSNIKYIQTDTAISPGNSGGPLINNRGEVLGILTFKLLEKGAEGLNFAIAINVAKKFRDGKLTRLEETVRQMEVERKRRFNDLFDNTYNVLSSTWKNEYTTYYNKIVWMIQNRHLSVEQSKQLLQRVTIPPTGFATLGDWLASLTARILKGEITVDEASGLIRSSFVL